MQVQLCHYDAKTPAKSHTIFFIFPFILSILFQQFPSLLHYLLLHSAPITNYLIVNCHSNTTFGF
jgi:hypothetical protein